MELSKRKGMELRNTSHLSISAKHLKSLSSPYLHCSALVCICSKKANRLLRQDPFHDPVDTSVIICTERVGLIFIPILISSFPGRKFRLGRERSSFKLLAKNMLLHNLKYNSAYRTCCTSLSSPAATVIMSPVSLLIVNMFGEGLLGACDKILYLSIPFCAFGSSASMAVTVIT